MKRNRITYLILIFASILSGLLSRRFSAHIPDFINSFLGDSIWAIMIFLGFCFILKTCNSLKTGLIGLIFCYLIEISQLYHAQWIDSIRHTTLGGLVLGFGFLWSDIAAYTLGIGVAVGLESAINRRRNQKSTELPAEYLFRRKSNE